MTSSRRRIIADLVLNIAAAGSIVLAVAWYFMGDLGEDILGSRGFSCFRYFTTDSNLLAAVSCVIWSIFQARRLKQPDVKVPSWVRALRLMSVTAVSVTLLTVLLFLVPMAVARSPKGFGVVWFFYEKNVFVLHLTGPLMCIVSFLMNDCGRPMPLKACLLALVPTAVYAAVYILFVAVLKQWPDFYGFTFGMNIPAAAAACAVMILFAYSVAVVLRLLQNRLLHRA